MDDEGARLGGSSAESRNLVLVATALAAEGVSVVVAGCLSVAAAMEGNFRGCWEFGGCAAERLGLLLWCCSEGHVYVVDDD